MSDLKKYSISNELIENLPHKNGEDSDFKKYSKEGKSTTWALLIGETMKYLTQINLKKDFYAGYMPEPYLLFLSNSKSLNIKIKESEKRFKSNIETEFKISKNFKLKILNQEVYSQYLTNKIGSVIFMIMTMESFINNLIPEKFEIIKENGTLTKADIEKNYNLKEKFREVIPRFKEIDDTQEYQKKYSKLLQLTKIRNSFVHLKTSSSINPLDPYLRDFEKLIVTDLDKECENVELLIDFINQMKNVHK